MDDVGAVRPGEEAPLDRLVAHLAPRIPGLNGPYALGQFHGGFANLTYVLRAGDRALVVRRPPLGPLPKGGHDMAREHRVLSALHPVYPRAPQALLYCDDPAIIGAPFLVMERRTGLVVRRDFPPGLRAAPDVERRCAFALIDALADLHRVDPAAAGLGDLGRPDGFALRQIEGWARRWEAAKDRDIPAFAALRDALARRAPAPLGVSVLHNDFKLDNCMFAPGAPDVVESVFDWDMATLGDPVVDLGVCLGYFAADRGAWGGMFSAEPVAGDFPAQAELADRWAARTGLAGADVGWATAFGLWKTAVVLQQIHVRWLRGQTRDDRFALLGPRVPELIDKAAAALEG